MSNIKILDCTLRDGGYINDFNFGKKVIQSIIQKLGDSKMDIIECGFLTETPKSEDLTQFSDLSQISNCIGAKAENTIYVGMIALGKDEMHYNNIPVYDGTSIDGIRITFHEHEIEKAVEFGKNLKNKGYKVFMQPIGTISYTDEHLIELIKTVNELEPYAFYIVDTLGTMYEKDLMRLFYLIDNNLKDSICMGFHSHNNLQLSFSNAQYLAALHTERKIIIDASVFGMGRGAGNLCTELLARYLNDNYHTDYNVIPLLEVVDEYLMPIFARMTWGYSVPYYLAAAKKCHPNYASYLMNRQTITVTQIDEMLEQIPMEERVLYNSKLIEKIYEENQSKQIDDTKVREIIKDALAEKKLLILAPGKTLETEKEKIQDFIDQNHPFIISINFIPNNFQYDWIFVSNFKRFGSMGEMLYKIQNNKKVVVTSNIKQESKDGIYAVDYTSLLNDCPEVSDNAGLMLIKLLNELGVQEINLAGFDGFSVHRADNYFDSKLYNNVEKEQLLDKNNKIRKVISQFDETMTIRFITDTLYHQGE